MTDELFYITNYDNEKVPDNSKLTRARDGMAIRTKQYKIHCSNNVTSIFVLGTKNEIQEEISSYDIAKKTWENKNLVRYFILNDFWNVIETSQENDHRVITVEFNCSCQAYVKETDSPSKASHLQHFQLLTKPTMARSIIFRVSADAKNPSNTQEKQKKRKKEQDPTTSSDIATSLQFKVQHYKEENVTEYFSSTLTIPDKGELKIDRNFVHWTKTCPLDAISSSDEVYIDADGPDVEFVRIHVRKVSDRNKGKRIWNVQKELVQAGQSFEVKVNETFKFVVYKFTLIKD